MTVELAIEENQEFMHIFFLIYKKMTLKIPKIC